jgi:hypothetical protein
MARAIKGLERSGFEVRSSLEFGYDVQTESLAALKWFDP